MAFAIAKGCSDVGGRDAAFIMLVDVKKDLRGERAVDGARGIHKIQGVHHDPQNDVNIALPLNVIEFTTIT